MLHLSPTNLCLILLLEARAFLARSPPLLNSVPHVHVAQVRLVSRRSRQLRSTLTGKGLALARSLERPRPACPLRGTPPRDILLDTTYLTFVRTLPEITCISSCTFAALMNLRNPMLNARVSRELGCIYAVHPLSSTSTTCPSLTWCCLLASCILLLLDSVVPLLPQVGGLGSQRQRQHQQL